MNILSFLIGLTLGVAGGVYHQKIKSENDTKTLLRTLEFATKKHAGQKRKNKTEEPYIIHPIQVCQYAATLGDSAGNLPVLQAALLHDTVEDTDTTFEELESEFGVHVRSLVEEMTDNKALPYEERKMLQIRNAEGHTKEAKIIKMADNVANLSDLARGEEGIPVKWDGLRVRQYFEWAKAVAMGLKGAAPKLDQRLSELKY